MFFLIFWIKSLSRAATGAAFVLCVFASTASAALSVTGGTLHVYASGGWGTDAPADISFSPPSVSDAAGSIFGPNYAHQIVSFSGAQATVSSLTLWSGGTSIASGSLNLTEDTPETMQVHINPGTVGPYYQGDVSLDAVGGGGNVFHRSFGASNFLPPIDFTTPLAPGQYTLTWSDTGRIVAGQSGGGGFDFTLSPAPAPEPSSLLLCSLSLLPLLISRRRRTPPSQP